MNELQLEPAGKIYEIKLKGHLNESWADWFDGMAFTHESDGTTTLTGKIIDQAIENLPEGPIVADNPWVSNPSLGEVQKDISALIRRFMIQTKGPEAPEKEMYQSVEGAKGELGFYLVGDGSERPYRLKIRSPCFYLVGALSHLLRGEMLADAVAIIGSIDIVLGEIDR